MANAGDLFGLGKTQATLTAGESVSSGEVAELGINGQAYQSQNLAPALYQTIEHGEIFPSFAAVGATTYIASNNKIMTCYRDSSDQIVTVLGTVNENTGAISWGAESTDSETAGSGILQVLDFTPNSDTGLILYRSATNTLKLMAIDVSGATASYGTAVTVETDNSSTYSTVMNKGSMMVVDPDTSRVVVGTADSASTFEVRTYVGSISGTTITLGSKNVADSTATGNAYRLADVYYDTTDDKTVVVYREDDGTNYTIYAIAGTASGTSMTFGTAASLYTDTSSNTVALGSHLDLTNNKYIILYRKGATSDISGKAYTLSSGAFTVGAEITANSSAQYLIDQIIHDPVANKYYCITSNNPGSNINEFILEITGDRTLVKVSEFHPNWTDTFDAGTMFAFYNEDGIIIGLEEDNQELNVINLSRDTTKPIENKRSVVDLFDADDQTFFGTNLRNDLVRINAGLVLVTGTGDILLAKSRGSQFYTKPAPLGVFKENITAASSGKVALTKDRQGRSVTASSLTPGFCYYSGADGVLSTGGLKDEFVGYALSTTELILGDRELHNS